MRDDRVVCPNCERRMVPRLITYRGDVQRTGRQESQEMKLALDVNRMSSFSVSAIGYLARNPELVVTERGSFCRFCLTSEDYTEDDGEGRFAVVVQTIWFVATYLVGAAIADSARKGDQLFVEGKIRRNHWTAKGRPEDTTFVLTGFRFGARREGPEAEGGSCPDEAPTRQHTRKRS